MLHRSKHEIKMRELLLSIYEDPSLARALIFKGGTACYFFHQLPRFSTDLDFNLVGSIQKQLVFSKVAQVASQVGSIKDQWKKLNTLFYLVEHTQGSSAIKIEISTRKEEQIFQSDIITFYGTPVQVMTKAHMFTSKLLSLTTRPKPTPRDLFDLHYFFAQNWEFDSEALGTLVSGSVRDYLAGLPTFIKANFNQRNVTQGLNHLLESESQRDLVKHKLIPELTQQIEIYLDSTSAD